MATLESANCPGTLDKNENQNLLYRALLQHPHEIGESYGQHLWFTVKVGGYLLLTILIIVTHGLLPFLFDHTGSARIAQLHHKFSTRTHQQSQISE